MSSPTETSLRVSDIDHENDKNSIIQIWNGINRPLGRVDVYPCHNRHRHDSSQCIFSHEYLFKYPLVRCRHCAAGYCRDEELCILETITDRAGIEAQVYSVCRGFVERLKSRMSEQALEGKKRQRNEDNEMLTPSAPIASILEPPVKKSSAIDSRRRSPSVTVLESSLTTANPRATPSPVSSPHVYLTIDSTTMDAALALMKSSVFEGILKISVRKFEELAGELEPSQLLKFEKDITKIPGGKTLVQIAKLKLENEELQRKLASRK